MNSEIPQREHFDRAEQLSPAWTLHTGAKAAHCTVWSHERGWELRLTIGRELVRSQVCRSQDELLATDKECRDAMLEKGWTRP